MEKNARRHSMHRNTSDSNRRENRPLVLILVLVALCLVGCDTSNQATSSQATTSQSEDSSAPELGFHYADEESLNVWESDILKVTYPSDWPVYEDDKESGLLTVSAPYGELCRYMIGLNMHPLSEFSSADDALDYMCTEPNAALNGARVDDVKTETFGDAVRQRVTFGYPDSEATGMVDFYYTGDSLEGVLIMGTPEAFEENGSDIQALLDSVILKSDAAPNFADDSSATKKDDASDSKDDTDDVTGSKSTFANTLKAMGTFEEKTVEGAGDDVVDIPCCPTPCIITLSHNGSRNFAVKSHDSSGNSVDLLVNTIGLYNGTVTTYFDYSTSAMLEISADGGWSATFKPMSSMEKATNGSTFTGDNVVYIDEDSITKLHFTHAGERNFAVKAVGMEKVDLLVNEIGAYDGTVIWTEPKAFFDVHADGEWSISW